MILTVKARSTRKINILGYVIEPELEFLSSVLVSRVASHASIPPAIDVPGDA